MSKLGNRCRKGVQVRQPQTFLCYLLPGLCFSAGLVASTSHSSDLLFPISLRAKLNTVKEQEKLLQIAADDNFKIPIITLEQWLRVLISDQIHTTSRNQQFLCRCPLPAESPPIFEELELRKRESTTPKSSKFFYKLSSSSHSETDLRKKITAVWFGH